MLQIKNDDGSITTVYRNAVESALSEFLEENGLKESDVEDMTQSRWCAALMYIQRVLFSGANANKLKKDDRWLNAYDIKQVDALMQVYIYLAYLYSKEISIYGFSLLSGIAQSTIYEWSTHDPENEEYHIYSALHVGREQSLSNKLADSRRNPVGVIAILNHSYGWSSPFVAEKQKQQPQSLEKIADSIGLDLLTTTNDDTDTDGVIGDLPTMDQTKN